MKLATSHTALIFAAFGVLFCAASAATAATATALVSATVLGPAGEETASGAVTLSRISGEAVTVDLSQPGGSDSPTLARFRVGGGLNSTFAVALPETAVVRGHGTELEVTGFRAAGERRLGSNGSSTIAVGADLRIPAGQLSGSYAGSFPVTIAYN